MTSTTNFKALLFLACVVSHRVSLGFTPQPSRCNLAVRPRFGVSAVQNNVCQSRAALLSRSAVATETETTTEDEIMFGESMGEAVVCARGICVLADEELATEELCYLDEDDEGNLVGMTCVESTSAQEQTPLSFEYLWPRALLLGCSLLYGTNFPLGRIMNDALPASATTSARMLLAFGVLSPFLFKLKPHLGKTAVVGGSFCALGYLAQSIALVDTPAATVAFLGALVVIITPLVSFVADKAKLGWKDAPQTWIAAILCLLGVAALELGGDGGLGNIGMGDFWSVMQAVGFGVGFYFTEKLMAKEPDMALPLTAVQVGMTAFWSSIWAVLDGTGMLGDFGGNQVAWLLDDVTRSQYAIPGVFLAGFGQDEVLRTVAIAAAWTGVVTTAVNRVGETTGLGKVSSSEASVLLSTEPLWAAVFAGLFLGESMGPNAILGGALIVAACLATTLKPQTIQNLFSEAPLEDDGSLAPVRSVNSAGLSVQYVSSTAASTAFVNSTISEF
mmetsp:Transcript_30279/g.54828  ORF Transcript_30279/g.54828 Transcript_30279/m.54828 type:complete len:503 (+) Transcript_30279:129-1637(+)|eukprot:CAMPEP_0201933902 /NCGR_PEP_ID=MMETSP0903-20130614/32532_1 /ASSEMBLY_ACC=CAM_ASM_000552 /TAXON_ID=420261 /ORGANISM="Thalassiosira antarctica, Strain CCMP982" /LENGTH=502 /DNA_ID=CAMNT_0048473971 /DNA_START=110 /DNA_END=1618 /DNA_ORIENTATION=-